jgi:hypothetical protein
MAVDVENEVQPQGTETVLNGTIRVSLLGQAPTAAKIRVYDNAERTGTPLAEADVTFGAVFTPDNSARSAALASGLMVARSLADGTVTTISRSESEAAEGEYADDTAAEGAYTLNLYPTGKGAFYYFELVVTDDGDTWVAKPLGGQQVVAGDAGQTIGAAGDTVIDFAGEDLLDYNLPDQTIEEEIIEEGRAPHQVPWKILWYIVPAVEVDGNRQTRMTLAEIVAAVGKAKEFERFVEESARGIVDIKIKPYVSKTTMVRFSGSATDLYFERATIPAFDLQEIGDLNSYDSIISTVKYHDISGNSLGHYIPKDDGTLSGWAGLNHGNGNTMTVLNGCGADVYIHEFCHHLERWYGHEIVPGIGGLMPTLHNNAQYHYTVAGQVQSYTLMYWYACYIGGTVQYFGGDAGTPANPTEAQGVHWNWWLHTPTKPEGYDIDLQPPVTNDDPDKILLKGTLSIASIVPIETAAITVVDGNGKPLGTQELTGFDNPTNAYRGTPEARRAGFAIIVDRPETPTPITFTVASVAENGFANTQAGLIASAETIANVDISDITLSLSMPTLTLSGSVAGIVTEDMNAVSISTVDIEAYIGTLKIGYTTVNYSQTTSWQIVTMPLPDTQSARVTAMVKMSIGYMTTPYAGDSRNPCRYLLPDAQRSIHTQNVTGIDFVKTIPLLTLSGTLRVNTSFPGLTNARFELGNPYAYFYSTAGYSPMWSNIGQVVFGSGQFSVNTPMPWSMKVPSGNESETGYSLDVKVYVGNDQFETTINTGITGGARNAGTQNITDYNIVVPVRGTVLSGTAQFNCITTNGASVTSATIEAYVPGNPEKILGAAILTNGAGLQNTPQSWSITVLPNTGYVQFRVKDVLGNKTIFGDPVQLVYPPPYYYVGNEDISGIALPPIKIWTTDEIIPNVTATINGSHISHLDGLDIPNGAEQFTNTVWVTTEEGKTAAWTAATNTLDTSRLINLAWHTASMSSTGWSISIPAFVNSTELFFFVERDGKFYAADESPFSAQGTGTHTVNLGTVDIGWQWIYIQGTVESVNFDTGGYVGRNRGVMVYVYWDAAYTQFAGASIVDQATHIYRIQKPLSDAGKTVYYTFVAYVIQLGTTQDVDVKTGWFQPASGQFNKTLVADSRNVLNFTGGMYIPDNNLMPIE